MIYDVFLFHGELEILELRLNILDKVVDKFVILECRQSFNGSPCPSYYRENRKRFDKWNDKIINYQFDLFEHKDLTEFSRQSPNTNGDPFWMKVFYCMEMMRKPLELCDDDDIIFISDVDEIWNPELPIFSDDKVYGYKQIIYYYYLNNRCDEDWTGSISTTYRRLKKEVLNYIKQKGEVKLNSGGWHFGYIGGEEEVKRKVSSSINSFYGQTPEGIVEKMKQNKDIFNARGYHFYSSEADLPKYLLSHREQYSHLFK